jgi:N-acetylneuraminic acid mutarotase
MKNNSSRMKNMRWITLLALSGLFFLNSCSTSDTTINGNWVKTTPFGGETRTGAFEFTIDNKAYVGLGSGGLNGTQYLLDCQMYDPDKGYWAPIDTFPGLGRELAVSFSVGKKGYVGTGFNRYQEVNKVELNDFWEYDSETNKWTQLKNFPAAARYNALAFSNGESGYVGLGYNGNYFNDFWEYHPGNDSWTQIASLIGDKREGAMAMTINNIVYVFGGDNNASYEQDLYQFDPTSKTWTNITKITTDANYNDFRAGVRRSNANAFELSGRGYVVCGLAGSTTTLVYQFDPTTTTWTKMTAFEGGARYQAVSFVVNNRAYVGTGTNGTRKLDDVYEWRPEETYNSAD